MVKLVDTSDLKSAAAGRAGSIPARGTISLHQAHPYMSLASNETLVFFCCLRFGSQYLNFDSRLGSFAGSFRHSRPAQLDRRPTEETASTLFAPSPACVGTQEHANRERGGFG